MSEAAPKKPISFLVEPAPPMSDETKRTLREAFRRSHVQFVDGLPTHEAVYATPETVAALREVFGEESIPRRLSPLRNLVHVRRVKPERTEGGLHIVHDYKARKSPRLTMAARPDYWPGIVLAVGPKVPDLRAGARVYVYMFAENTGNPLGLYTGERRGDDEYLIEYPHDIVCAVEDATW